MIGTVKDGAFLVVAENEGGSTLEHFLFKLNNVGAGTVVWGTARASEKITKSSVMTAQCWPPP
jgi:hypothetical protein